MRRSVPADARSLGVASLACRATRAWASHRGVRRVSAAGSPDARPGPSETVFITGATSGIGAGLARAFHARGATVVISGRDSTALARMAAECPGMETEVLDVRDATAVARCAAAVGARHPEISTVISNAGVQRLLDFADDRPCDAAVLADLGTEVDANLKGVLYVARAFAPLLRRPHAGHPGQRPARADSARPRLVHVSSGLAFVPLVAAPVYSATKAAVRAFTVALREQLRPTGVQVVELIPPVVDTNLHRGLPRTPPRAMSLDAFVRAAMRGLDGRHDEVTVGLAAVLRVGARVAPGRLLRLVNRPL